MNVCFKSFISYKYYVEHKNLELPELRLLLPEKFKMGAEKCAKIKMYTYAWHLRSKSLNICYIIFYSWRVCLTIKFKWLRDLWTHEKFKKYINKRKWKFFIADKISIWKEKVWYETFYTLQMLYWNIIRAVYGILFHGPKNIQYGSLQNG